MKIFNSIVLIYLIIINLVSFIIMGVDKSRAKKGQWRIPESQFMTLAFIGGAIGSFLGMRTFRHKTKHIKFLVFVPIAIICNFATLYFLYFKIIKI